MNIQLGSTSRDRITGSSGADLLIGLGGNDTINGGDGDDILVGHQLGASARNEIDTLTGGRGADRFVVAGGYLGDGASGYALITDFSLAQRDQLILARGLRYTFRQTQSGTEVLAGGDLIAQLRGAFLGSGTVDSRTSWVGFI
jgi:Ca2+-binding RTX toxin-like protein